ncbi:unnamed protein product, partial [Rotaria magnacalcarata]
MPTTLKYVLVFLMFATVNGSFRLYSTNVSDSSDYKDFLYSFMLKSDVNEWQLVPYCIRHNVPSINVDNEQCYGNEIYIFEQLKLKNIDSHHLYRWNAPIDTINDYEKYRAGYDLLLGSHRYCNCSAEWFGTQCQYSFFQSNKTATFDDVIMSQFKRKTRLKNKDVLNDPLLSTCYVGLRCHSMICLDWRQICDGSINCEHGEDEPDECVLLETNECKNDEHRCRSGMCIPRTFLVDFSVDCMDLSDETETYNSWPVESACSAIPMLICDFRLCDMGYFSCEDGQCIHLSSRDHESSCRNLRDVLLRQSLLTSTQNGSKRSNNINSECRHLMLCLSQKNTLYLDPSACLKCECTEQTVDARRYLQYFRKHCPSSFLFQNEADFLHPFVQSLYHNTPEYSSEWWLPTHFCYNQSQCPTFPITGSPLIDGLICIENNQIKHSLRVYGDFELLFSACSSPHTSTLADDSRLFYCDRSMKFISKYRLSDNSVDCFYKEDEFVNVTFMSTLNLTYHFKSKATDQWFARPLIGGGICEDYSDTLYIGGCKTASDIGCQFLRGLYTPPVYYVFQENCNGILKIRNYTVGDETDETNCEEWRWPQNRPRDGYWDDINGEDELNCPNTIYSYITHKSFNCSVSEHYCMRKSGVVECLSKERAGDNITNCVGTTDERTRSCAFLYPLHPFECANFDCIPLFALCDGHRDCPGDDDELICPEYYRCEYPDFTCNKGNVCIGRTRQCDGIIDCQPNGEDELFCDLASRRITQFSLDKIEEYPRVIDSSDLMITTTTLHSFASLPVNVLLKSESFNPTEAWFCNRGIIIKTRSL